VGTLRNEEKVYQCQMKVNTVMMKECYNAACSFANGQITMVSGMGGSAMFGKGLVSMSPDGIDQKLAPEIMRV